MDSFGVKQAACILSLWVGGLAFVSCEGNFQNPPVNSDEIIGKYKGTISFEKFVSLEGDTKTILEKEIELKIGNECVTIYDFPISTILSGMEDNESIKEIEKELGPINYQIGYTVQPNEGKEWVILNLSPRPLNFSYTVMGGSKKEISAIMNTGIKISHYESMKLQLKIIIEEITINNRTLFIMDEQYVTMNARKEPETNQNR